MLLKKLTTLRLRSRMQLVQLVFFSKQSSKATKFSDGIMPRTERRLLERKERNSARKKAKIHSSPEKLSSTLLKSQRFLYSLVPRLPGRPQSFVSRSHLIAISYRLPLFLVLSYFLTDENTSPYIIQASLGPSMLPTIQFAGDIWVVETGAWERVWNRIFSRQDEGNFPTSSSYKVGDLLIWEDPKTGKRSCKRLIGLEGDEVSRYGEFGDLKYKHRSDFGIIWPKTYTEKDKIQYNDNQDSKAEAPPPRILVVPENCVWLEGDCPLFSMDSRQYGPINANKIRGRLVFRLWPWKRSDLTNDKENAYLSSCWISRDRPVPYPSIEAYIGKRFDFYRLPSTNPTQNHAKRDTGE